MIKEKQKFQKVFYNYLRAILIMKFEKDFKDAIINLPLREKSNWLDFDEVKELIN